MPVPAGESLRIRGIVQGVGFRPFVANLAHRLGLCGDVLNDAQGVQVRLFGDPAARDAFRKALLEQAPPLARIDDVASESIPGEDISGFSILASHAGGERMADVTPDAAICKDCRREMLDPVDRRFGYAFINCTHCGPRYTIIKKVPYDRPNTVMSVFPMCDACRAEYENPADRRFHAQPVCCPDCGPKLWTTDAAGKDLPGDPVEETARVLREGGIAAIKGIGGFHLACDATDETAVQRLRQRKFREEKPLAVMAASVETALELVRAPDYAGRLLSGPVAPILIAAKAADTPLAPSISPVTDTFGVMVTYAPLHVLLFDRPGIEFLVMTSANQTDEPICTDNDDALDRLAGVADIFLMHDRDIDQRVDDSVLMATPGAPTIIRRARGYVPTRIETGRDVDGVIAFGPLLKNTVAVGRETGIFVGQHAGDLDHAGALEMTAEVMEHLVSLLGVTPSVVACDLHPDFPSTRLAEKSGLPLTAVQHHHAHLVSLMAEKRRFDRAIGFSLDGTGFGDDGKIWGGEVFSFDPASYTREFQLEYVALPGGDRAAREPWRMAVSYLHHHGIDPGPWVAHPKAGQVVALLDSTMPVLETSAVGRLFDAVSSLTGLCQESTFEAKAPMALEGVAGSDPGAYPFELEGDQIRTGGLIRAILEEIDRDVPVGDISSRFHNTLADVILACARKIRDRDGLTEVYLSGGVFLNAVLLDRAVGRLKEDGFSVFTHSLLPPSDGGVSAGQVMVAAARR